MLFKSLFALLVAGAAFAAPAVPGQDIAVRSSGALSTRQHEWIYYDTEELCLAAGWGYCRRYAVGVGISKWVGFPGDPPPVSKRYDTEEECLKEHTHCLGYKRADGTWRWFGVDYEEEEERRDIAPVQVKRQSEWIYYDTEELCLAAGWGYCRRYAVDVGVSKWVGFPGTPPETTKFYNSEPECLKEHVYCLGFKRADGTWRWFGADELAEERRRDVAVVQVKRQSEWIYYDTEELCLAAGWGYCRRYAVGVGISKWVGFSGEPPVPTKYYNSEPECLKEHTYCLGFKRADGTWRWFGVEDYEE